MKHEPSLTNQAVAHRRSSVFRLIGLCIVFGLVAGVFFYGSTVYDWARAMHFTPSEQLATAEQRIGFTSRGEQIFYATQPSIEDKSAFNTSCASTERTVAVLGCYTTDRIYLYNIQNAELDGTLEVTAAHEMLHAAYSRLNYFERQSVNDMIKQEYELIKDRPEISQAMQYYSKAEPGAELDELHSIIGTTISDLSPSFEQYYARYFTNRSAVVALNAKYTAMFSDLSKQADALQKQIDTESASLKSDMAAYQVDLAQLNLDIGSFNTRASSGAFRSQSEFTTARSALEQRVNELNTRRALLNDRVTAYNAMIDQLNKLAVRATTLNSSLNGVDAPGEV